MLTDSPGLFRDPRRLGWSEVAVATTFVLLLIAAFRFTPLAG